MRTPNFFILGAPKSGTTAMVRYLATHPGIFMSNPKEPAFFATDYPRLKEKHALRFDTLADYLAIFQQARADQAIVGEGSTAYLSSRDAVRNILEFNPDARFLVMLRNPVEFAPSFHSQKLVDLSETERDFQTAWRLQTERAAGRSIPKSCLEPQLLQYAQMGAFGSQLERLFAFADRRRVHVILFDDFVRAPGDAYRDVLAFLNLPDDGRREFPLVNQAKEHRLRWCYRFFMTRPGRWVRRMANHHPWAKAFKEQVIFKPKQREALGPDFRLELIEAFRPEIERLSQLLSRDLTRWTAAP